MNMIAAVDDNWGIGYKGSLLVRIPSDQKYLQQVTLGNVVVMGRKTLQSLPGGKPLPGRTNLILSRKKNLKVRGAEVFSSPEEVMDRLKDYPSERIFVLGGGEIYRLFLPCTDTIHVTKVHHCYQADTWFPDLDASGEWQITQDSGEMTYFDLEFEFLKYERKRTAD